MNLRILTISLLLGALALAGCSSTSSHKTDATAAAAPATQSKSVGTGRTWDENGQVIRVSN